MKIHRKLLFRIIIFSAVLLCYGVNVYSNFNVPSYNIELSTGTNGDDNSMSSDNDSYNEDQINQPDGFRLPGEPLLKNPIPKDDFLNYNYCFSVWQPPKNL